MNYKVQVSFNLFYNNLHIFKILEYKCIFITMLEVLYKRIEKFTLKILIFFYN